MEIKWRVKLILAVRICENCLWEELMEDLLLEMFCIRTKHKQIPLKTPDFYLLLFPIFAGAVNVLISVV